MNTTSRRNRFRRPIAWVIGLALVILLIPLGLVWWVESESGQRFIETRVSEATGRQISIGDIDLKLGWTPGIAVSGLRITNPEWAKSPDLINTELIDARFRLLPIFAGRGIVEELTLVQARLGIEREEKRNTWTFKEREQQEENDGPSRFFVRHIKVDRGFVFFRDTTLDTALEIDVAGDVGSAEAAIDLHARGTLQGQPTRAVARLPGLLPNPDTAVAMSAALTIGKITAAAAGTVRAADVDGIDIDIDVSGASLADLKAVVPKLNLPNTPPYRLQGRFRNPADAFIFDPFAGRVGDSDLSGAATYSRGGQRPVLKANLVSTLLDFDDLGPLVGAPSRTGQGETAAPEQKRQVAKIKATGKVLPQKEFAVADWSVMDADVRFRGKRILDAAKVPIEELNAHWIMEAGVLRFEPLQFRLAGGTIRADIRLDSNEKPLAGKAAINLQGINLRTLVPGDSRMQDPLGTLYGRLDIAGRGASVASLLGTSDGRLAMMVNGGKVSNLLMELVGLDVAEALRILATKDPDVQLRCAIADFGLKNGVATPNAFIIDTTDTVVTGSGSVSFKSESFDLTTRAEPKDFSPFVLRTPINIKGTFNDPQVRPQIGPLAARAAGSILLSLVNPLLAVVPFVETGPGEDTDCGQLLRQVKSQGVKVPAKGTATR